jgi:UPF0755 protein
MSGLLKLSLAAVAVVVVASSATAYWAYSAVTSPVAHAKSGEYITIEKGSSPPQIVSRLHAEGILSSETATNLYLRLFGDASKLQAGEYQFPSPITAMDALKLLEKGEDRTIRLTIPEGFTRFDIAKRLAERLPQNPPVDEKSILALMDDTTLIRDIAPEATNLEGYMYPTTYNVPRGTTPAEAVKIMVGQFRKFWKPEWQEAARRINRTPHQIVTIASLIETETSVESERPIVASVINNRLKQGMRLGIDQTNVYIAKMLGRWDGTINQSDLDVDSPYNTRIKFGLPPGPISSVTESSIRAALSPAETEFLFYVRNTDVNDGSHWFYASAAEFEKGKAKYQEWLEEERRIERQQQSAPTQ